MKTDIYGKQLRSGRNFRPANRLLSSIEPALSRRKRFSAACRNKLNALKELVTRQLTAQYADSLSATLFRQAIQEADALAASTRFPALFLPVLAEEKVRSASMWSKRQEQIRQETIALGK